MHAGGRPLNPSSELKPALLTHAARHAAVGGELDRGGGLMPRGAAPGELATYRHLNLERRWPGFALDGLAVGDDGALSLAPLPRLADALTEALPPLPALDGPAGVGVAPNGDVYVADAARHRILRVPDCGGVAEPLRCLRGLLDTPRGVLAGPRDALYVADSGNARVVVIDLATEQVRDVWGVPRGDPRPSDAPGGFVQPWDLAADRHGHVYVADPGEQAADGTWSRGRVQKLRADGTPARGFAETLAEQARAPRRAGERRDGAARPGGPRERAAARPRPAAGAPARLRPRRLARPRGHRAVGRRTLRRHGSGRRAPRVRRGRRGGALRGGRGARARARLRRGRRVPRRRAGG
jgi:hypothetical protein